MKVARRAVSGLLWGFLPAFSFAADTPAPTSAVGLFQVFLALALVIAAIVGAAWLLRRFGPVQMGAGGAMRVLGGVMVGPRERLVLVEVGETWLIVGVAQGRVSAVHRMVRPAGGLGKPADELPQAGFGDWLKAAWNKRQGGSP